jgi:hypothetical protein
MGAFIMSCMLIGIAFASSFQISSVYLNNTANPGQPLTPNQPQSQAVWTFNTSFNSTGQGINANISSGAINYTDSAGRIISAAYPLQISGALSQQKTSYYAVDTLGRIPIQTMSSYVTLGSVYQGSGYFQNATAAPQCSSTGLYSEWDFSVYVQFNLTSGARNVVVGRVCIYNQTIGWIEALPKSPTARLLANVSLYANGQREMLQLPQNMTPAIASDKLAEAWWINQTGIAADDVAPPNGTQYVAVNGSKNGRWYLQASDAYMKWYNQYYKFAQNKIPNLDEQYSPSSVGILSNACNVVSASDLTNQSVKNAVNCMNDTASLYYSFANQQAMQLMSSVQNMSGYQYAVTSLGGKPVVAVNLPGRFLSNPKIRFSLNGQFLGFSLPAGAPQILIINASPVSMEGAGTLTMLVENYGNKPDLFTVSINDCPGVSTEQGVSYSVGADRVVNITTSYTAPNANLTLNQQCAVRVRGVNGGGNTREVTLVSETPNQYLHDEFQGIRDAVCNSDGIFTQLLCQYVGMG